MFIRIRGEQPPTCERGPNHTQTSAFKFVGMSREYEAADPDDRDDDEADETSEMSDEDDDEGAA